MRADATTLARAIREGSVTAVGVMRASLDAVARQEGLGAVAHLDAGMGMAAARAADAERIADPARFGARPFGGVPTLAKDLGGPFAGLPVAAGSRLLHRSGGAAESDLAARFREAGLLPFGLTTTPEFGLSLASEPAVGPLCRNPLDRLRTAGGSSGGAAASVAAGIVAIAHATDAGGSIRVPAACCGLVGLKPGRGVMPAGPSFGNHLGGIASELAVTRSVRDTAALFDAVRGNTRGPFADAEPLPVTDQRLRIGVLCETGAAFPTDPDRASAVEAAAKALEAAGHLCFPLDRRIFDAMAAASGRTFGDIVAANLALLVETLSLDVAIAEPLTQAFVARGQALPAAALWASLDAGVKAGRALWTLFEDLDVILTPMLATAPPPVGSFPSDHADTDLHLHRMAAFAPLAALANISGFPAITLSFGADADGLPLPVQMIAPFGGEYRLLALAARLESEERWRHPFPIAGLHA
ncbi:amidase [Ensifer soli]|uniref:amidase n=1 Tax=Ciceribacter sp. sgz301302 TaxID=3342379 RepID=UPI0035B73ADB